MDEEVFNQSIRKFLKTVGVGGQRDIEQAVRAALADGRLLGGETLVARMRLEIPALGLSVHTEGEIRLQ